MMRHRLALTGGLLLVLIAGFCFLGPLIHHTDQTDVDLVNAALPPGAGHLLGTDTNGFDVLGRLMTGGRLSLQIGLLAALISTVIGTVYGAVAGLAGGVVHGFLMRLVDVMLSIPFLFVVLILSARFAASALTLSLVIGGFSWLLSARLIRGEVLALRVREFVLAAKVMGASRRRIIFTHLIPHALGVIIINATFQVADAIIVVSALGFLGFGMTYPTVDWGSQLADGASYLSTGYWWLVYPVGACIVLTVLALNLLADALRDAIGRPTSPSSQN
ncbi:ABC transporter permease [Streptomyces sp. SID13666]|uniref:ABC transporter permease n=1 Tax=unclassified Streptomyces TaxID=2593676 RepID=UPI0013C0B4BE|nr:MULTISPECIES: ABC transporter permease [unclassified Streptomyces]NEA53270.1 ABC transporter permease [Streptomyces sp. SID13666]NEA69403.1 ABC transporter permease [Streptomyces sp. SID13588]